MKIRSIFVTAAAGTLAMTACGGGGGTGPQTEQGAIDAALAVQRGALEGDADPFLDRLSADCKASVDESEIKLAFGFIRMMMSDAEFELDDIGVDATIDEFTGDTASVAVVFDLPEGADDGTFGFSDETMDLEYEDGKWVLADCDFEDTSESAAEDRAAALAELGYAGTRDEPVPAGVGVPLGDGFTVSVDEVLADAGSYIEEQGGYATELEAGTQTVLVRVTIGYAGETEPASPGDISFGVVGTSGVGVDLYSCRSIPEELDSYSVGLMSGGVVSGAVCGDVPTADVADLVVSVEQGFGNTPVFFDPTLTPKTPVPVVATSGPSAEGTLSADRATPIALGTATDIGEGWTLTINGADLDATETVLGYSEYNEVPMSGQRFVLLDVSMTYNGEDEPATAAFVDIDLVGDGNVTSAVGSCQATIEGELDRYSDLYIGGTIDGAVCAVVAEADVDSLVAVATVGYGEDPFVLAVR